jgi:uncharacterized protein YbjT (DUF2867 family)
MTSTVVVAGATGDLGGRIVRSLLAHEDVVVRALTRPGSAASRAGLGEADDDRVAVVAAAYDDPEALEAAVRGADVVVSAVSGTRAVIVDAQRALLDAAVRAGVERFLPSDYSADYRRISVGSNRNFELRREFAADVDAADIRATSVLNGMFTDLLTGQAPLVQFDRQVVLYWSSADQLLDFTTMDDTARTVAHVALDTAAPRVVEVAGETTSARGIAEALSRMTGRPFRTQWAGTTGTLAAMSRIGRRFSSEDETFPAWQGMQYSVSMFSGQAKLHHVRNDRYGDEHWTSVTDVLSRRERP